MRPPILFAAGGMIVVAAFALGLVLAFGQSSAEVSTVRGPTLAVDTNVDGNTKSSLGDLQTCSEASVDSNLAIDITVRDIPSSPDVTRSGMRAFQFVLLYDPEILRVTSVETKLLIDNNPGSYLVDLTPEISQTPGRYTVAAFDFGSGSNEAGSGPIARVSFQVIGRGTSRLVLEDAKVGASADHVHQLADSKGGEIRVGESCA